MSTIINLVTFCRVYWKRQRLDVGVMDILIPPTSEEESFMVARVSLQMKQLHSKILV